jgi:hypothetical protein
MIFKCEFLIPLLLVVGFNYKFKHTSGGGIDAIYLGKSRIDGYDMFKITNDYLLSGTLADCSLNGSYIKYSSLSIMTPLEVTGNLAYANNKETLLNFFMKLHNITDLDLQDDSKFKSIMRNFNIEEVIKNQ